ncbi:hypothetical protein CJF42_06210 [Pseudoalteromonas sp. NBT06-2]|uniref:hypothetical protein n=1 Tax=Pseudoalteromonas sp. NBT06-2 TaxID=2025950 RepID=UPI000BA767D4|nr:hypothetical protein [Pseudoalteromonas sp. NBT06-2]PAJ75240.1 hypothetical protein CJF42_06210 [Pseudoalteromonas sp. NBT06-2]
MQGKLNSQLFLDAIETWESKTKEKFNVSSTEDMVTVMFEISQDTTNKFFDLQEKLSLKIQPNHL